MSYYWISWVQPGDDVRPLHYPPGERVLGWWSTGYAQELTGRPCKARGSHPTRCRSG